MNAEQNVMEELEDRIWKIAEERNKPILAEAKGKAKEFRQSLDKVQDLSDNGDLAKLLSNPTFQEKRENSV